MVSSWYNILQTMTTHVHMVQTLDARTRYCLYGSANAHEIKNTQFSRETYNRHTRNRNTFRLLYKTDICVQKSGRCFNLFDGQQDDVGGDDLDDVHLEQPPDEELQLMEVLQELEEQDREPVQHQVPFILEV